MVSTDHPINHSPLADLFNHTVLVRGTAWTDNSPKLLVHLKVGETMVIVVGSSSWCGMLMLLLVVVIVGVMVVS